MCRMIAKVAVHETSVMDEMMNCPYSLEYLSEQGRQPDNPAQRGQHRDGCGMAFIHSNRTEIHKRDRDHAWDDSYIQTVRDARSKFFIAHNRLASGGLKPMVAASHPFSHFAQGNTYAFSHNGTIYNYLDEAKSRGTSDSYIFLEKLISETEPNDDENIIKRLTHIAKTTQFTSMIAFLLAPDRLLVWRIFNESEKTEDRNLYYTMYMKLAHESVVFSSEPLDDGSWTLLPNNTFVAVKPLGLYLDLHYRLLF